MRGSCRARRDHGLELVEDACQAHGASARRRACRDDGTTPARSASIRRKNLGAMGDAGALVTDDAELAETVSGAARARPAREVQARRRRVDRRASTRSTPPCSSESCPYLDEWNAPAARRRRSLRRGSRGRRRPRPAGHERPRPGVAPVRRPHGRSVTGSPTISPRGNIGTGRHYPEPPHLSAAYAHLGLRGGVVPGRRAARQGAPLASDLPGHHRGAGRAGRRERPRLVRPWLTGRSTTRPIGIARRRRVRRGVVVQSFTNLYGCRIGDNTRIGPFVEIQRGAVIGANCKIQSHTFICDGVTIEDEVFVGHGVMFVNDKYPRATTTDGRLQGEADWELPRDRRRARRDDRFGRGRARRGPRRRARARRRRCGRDSRRRAWRGRPRRAGARAVELTSSPQAGDGGRIQSSARGAESARSASDSRTMSARTGRSHASRHHGVDGAPTKPLALVQIARADHSVEDVAIALELDQLPGSLVDESLDPSLHGKVLPQKGTISRSNHRPLFLPSASSVGSISSLERI